MSHISKYAPDSGHRRHPVTGVIQTLKKDIDEIDAREADWYEATQAHATELESFFPGGEVADVDPPKSIQDISNSRNIPETEKEVGRWFQGLGQSGEKIGNNNVEGQSAHSRAWQHAVSSLGLERINDIEIISGTGTRAGYISWQLKGQGKPADQTWTVYEAGDGSIFMYDKEVGPSSRETLVAASTVTPTGPGVEIVKDEEGQPATITNADGSVTTFYSVTDGSGRTSMQKVTTPAASVAPQESDIITFDDADGGGRLIPLGDGKYTYEPPEDEPFTTRPSDVVPLPAQGGSLIKISANQYQFVRDTFDPGRKVDETGREYLQQIDGSWSELAPRFEPELMRADGMNLFQQRSGQVSQLTPPNMDDIITQALIDGDVDKAFAFQDFQNRPTAQESFQTALDFARSPADQRIISALARGEMPVQPPPSGTIQRVGPQPDFLLKEYQDYQRRTQAGRAPTDEEATNLSARAAAGQTPLTDTLQIQNETLQTRLEALNRDMERKDEEHAVKIEGMRQSQVEQGQLFTTKNNIAMGLNGDGTKKDSDSTASGNGLFSGAVGNDATGAGSTTQTDFQRLSGKSYLTPAEAAEAHASFMETRVANPLLSPTQQAYFDELNMDTAGMSAAALNSHLAVGRGDPTSPIYRDNTQVTDIPFVAPKEEVVPEQVVPEQVVPEQVVPKTLVPTEAPDIATPNQEEIRSQTRRNIDSFLTQTDGRTGSPTISLGGYEPSTSFADIAAARGVPVNPVRTVDPEVQRTQDIASARSERMDLASALSAARGQSKRESWASNPDVIAAQKEYDASTKSYNTLRGMAGGGTVQPGEITVVGEQGPEIAMMPPGTHILPLGKATKKDIRAAQSTGRAYGNGGIVFGDLPIGLQQLQRGRPITPPRGYLFQQGGLTMPSAQALQNLTPGTRESFYGMAGDIGISPAEFRQELQTATPRGSRLPTSRTLPLGRRGVR